MYGTAELNSTITSHQSNDENSSNAYSQYQQSPCIGSNMGGRCLKFHFISRLDIIVNHHFARYFRIISNLNFGLNSLSIGSMVGDRQMPPYPDEHFYIGKYLGYDSSFYRENSVSSNKSRSSISSGSTQKSTNRNYIHKRGDSDLTYLIKNAYSMSRDKKKCMKLQTRVEEERNNNEFIDELFKRLTPVFSEIMMDPYANYF